MDEPGEDLMSDGLNCAEEDKSENSQSESQNTIGEQNEPGASNENATSVISKSEMKRRKRKQQWEEGRADRKKRRKEKIKAKKQRKREQLQNGEQLPEDRLKIPRRKPIQVPVTIVIDCQFDDMMSEKEMISLGSQITRAYSDNKKYPFRVHLVISSFDKRLKDRFEKVLSNSHHSWSGIRFRESDYVEVAKEADVWMKEPRGGEIAGALLKAKPTDEEAEEDDPSEKDEDHSEEIVYLTSDSPNTIEVLKPYSTYIVGGIVDRNRHKGICYKRALDDNVKTAKLPIGELLNMQSRSVLATNHVVEIMLSWLDSAEWGEALTKVMPKRKGGTLKNYADDAQEDDDCSGHADRAQEFENNHSDSDHTV